MPAAKPKGRTDRYWAAAPAGEIAAEITQRFDDYIEVCRITGRLDLWRKVYRATNGMDREGRHIAAEAARLGEQGEIVSMKANHARNLSNHIVNLTCESRLSFDCRAKNTDSESSEQTLCGQQWLDDRVREGGVGRTLRKAAKIATDYSEAFVVTDWDKDAGEVYEVVMPPEAPAGVAPERLGQLEQQEPEYVHAGDVVVKAFYPDDVARDFHEESDGKSPWHITREEVSIFRLAAKYPKHRDAILQLGSVIRHSDTILPDHYGSARDQNSGQRTIVHTLYHAPTPELREGRVVVVADELELDDRTLVTDQYDVDAAGVEKVTPKHLPYPVHRMAPEDQGKTCFGYTSTFDLLTINDLIDALYSACATNAVTSAVNNFWSPPGNTVSVSELAGALNLIQSQVKPEVLELNKIGGESFELIKMSETLLEIISGVNSVARGNPDGALKGASGSALALLQSMTIQFASGLQEGYGQLAESVGQAMMELFQAFATIERWVQVVGKADQKYARQMTRDDVAAVSKVVVDLGNPATRTFAGRKQLADEMLQQGMFKRPQQYLLFIATGRFEALLESEQSQLIRIKRENEWLRAGKPVKALITDPHDTEVLEHLAVLDDPEARANPQLSQTVLAHVQEHMQLNLAMPPEMRALLGRAPLPMPMPGMPPGAPGPDGAPQETAPGPAPEQPAPDAGAMPAMPTNPLTGEQAPAA